MKPHPGEVLRHIIEDSGRSSVLWARDLNISEKHLSQILNGRTGYSADLAVRIQERSNVDALYLMHLKVEYEVDQAKARRKAATTR